jgi:hypothetical protein
VGGTWCAQGACHGDGDGDGDGGGGGDSGGDGDVNGDDDRPVSRVCSPPAWRCG